eukprot:Skav221870  [mRNA]  locus=scaffold1395:145381:146355:+ [translate_table: standard]
MTAAKSSPSVRPEEPSHSQAKTLKPPRSDLYPEESPPFRKYGYWSCAATGNTKDRPTALILFSGRARPGDLHQLLVGLGWRVCSIDTISPKATNILDEGVWSALEKDLELGLFDYIHIATPCGTFSPLREKPPGPRPLRSFEQVTGLPKKQLSPAEQKQLREGNIFVSRSASTISLARKRRKPWTLENPVHGEGKPAIWYMPAIKQILALDTVKQVDFDQCMLDLETTKPTKIVSEGVDLSSLDGLRCNHALQDFVDPNGRPYRAAHESAVQRWRTLPDGSQERASKALGEYTVKLCGTLAKAAHLTQKGATWLTAELNSDKLP